MGRMIYANGRPGMDIDDRALAHLRVVIFMKLRRGESFGFSWTHKSNTHGRRSVWLDSAIPLEFAFYGSTPPSLNRTWIEKLTISASSPGGLVMIDEPLDIWNESGAESMH